MPPVTIESEAMWVGVLPDYGARVVSLVDKATGRDWIYGGGQSSQTGEGAVYAADEAVGWDECFPTVSPCDATATMWDRRLRDHGDLWGRPWTVDARTDRSLSTSLAAKEFRFSRSLTVSGTALTCDYAVENRTPEPMPYLWALHGLLAVVPGESIVLPAVARLTSTYLVTHGRPLATPVLAWPETPELGFSLAQVQPEAAGFAGKFYAVGRNGVAAVGRADRWLTITWDQSIPALGIWANYHGWPTPPFGHHLALEPTTAPADDLAAALAHGDAAWVAPGATHRWTISMTLAGSAP